MPVMLLDDSEPIACYGIDSLRVLYATIPRVYQTAVSLPYAPLREFQVRVKNLPTTAKAERLVVQRIGQVVFRSGLMDYWQGIVRSPASQIPHSCELLTSSRWKDSSSNAERLDVHNGLLLSTLWDAAFDHGLVTFDDEGRPKFARHLSEATRHEPRWRS